MKYSVILYNGKKTDNTDRAHLSSFDFSPRRPPLATFLSLRRCTRQVYNKSTLRLAVFRTLGGAGVTELNLLIVHYH